MMNHPGRTTRPWFVRSTVKARFKGDIATMKEIIGNRCHERGKILERAKNIGKSQSP